MFSFLPASGYGQNNTNRGDWRGRIHRQGPFTAAGTHDVALLIEVADDDVMFAAPSQTIRAGGNTIAWDTFEEL